MSRLSYCFLVLIIAFPAMSWAQAEGPSLPLTQNPPLTQAFSQPEFGYALRYPASWTRDETKGYTAVFTSPPGAEAQFVSLAISNLQSPRRGQPKQGGAALLQKYLSELDQANLDATLLTSVPFIYKRDKVMIEGFQAVTEFSSGDGRLRQWTVILPRPGGTVVHVWSYTADILSFDAHIATIQAMLNSWTLLGDDVR